jgi:hypothetical protein
MAGQNSAGSYVDALREKMAHAPVVPPVVAEAEKTQASLSEAIEPKLVAVVTNMGRNDRFHPTRALPGEELLQGFLRSCTGFLLYEETMEIEVDQATVRRDTKHL